VAAAVVLLTGVLVVQEVEEASVIRMVLLVQQVRVMMEETVTLWEGVFRVGVEAVLPARGQMVLTLSLVVMEVEEQLILSVVRP
jgi:hypothetical protein